MTVELSILETAAFIKKLLGAALEITPPAAKDAKDVYSVNEVNALNALNSLYDIIDAGTTSTDSAISAISAAHTACAISATSAASAANDVNSIYDINPTHDVSPNSAIRAVREKVESLVYSDPRRKERLATKSFPSLTEIICNPSDTDLLDTVGDALSVVILQLIDSVEQGNMDIPEFHRMLGVFNYLPIWVGEFPYHSSEALHRTAVALLIFSTDYTISGGSVKWGTRHQTIAKSPKTPPRILAEMACNNRELAYIDVDMIPNRRFTSIFGTRGAPTNWGLIARLFPYEWATLPTQELISFTRKHWDFRYANDIEAVLDSLPEPETPVYSMTTEHRIYLLRHIATMLTDSNAFKKLWIKLLNSKWSKESVDSVHLAGMMLHNGMCAAKWEGTSRSVYSSSHTGYDRGNVGFNSYLFELQANKDTFSFSPATLAVCPPNQHTLDINTRLVAAQPTIENSGDLNNSMFGRAHTDFLYKLILGNTTNSKYKVAEAMLLSRSPVVPDWIKVMDSKKYWAGIHMDKLTEHKLVPLFPNDRFRVAAGLSLVKNTAEVTPLYDNNNSHPGFVLTSIVKLIGFIPEDRELKPTMPLEVPALLRLLGNHTIDEIAIGRAPFNGATNLVNTNPFARLTSVIGPSIVHQDPQPYANTVTARLAINSYINVLKSPELTTEVRDILDSMPSIKLDKDSFPTDHYILSCLNYSLDNMSRGISLTIQPDSVLHRSYNDRRDRTELGSVDNLGCPPPSSEFGAYFRKGGVMSRARRLKQGTYTSTLYSAGGRSRG